MTTIKYLIITFIFTPLVICLFLTSFSFALEKKVDSERVIIRSSFQEDSERPLLKNHQYDLQSAPINLSDYLPILDYTNPILPQDFSDSVTLDWLTTTSGTLAELFLGGQGLFENGVILYREGQWVEAKEKMKLIKITSPYHEQAILWMSWINFKQNLYDESLNTIRVLLQSNNVLIKIEALYLTALINHLQGSPLYSIQYLDPIFESIPRGIWDSRLNYLYLYNLIQQKKWDSVKDFINRFNRSDQLYSPNYHKLIEFEGLLAFNNQQYKQAIKLFTQVKKLDVDQKNLFLYERALSWSLFFVGQFDLLEKNLKSKNRDYWQKYYNEIEYLKLLNFLKQKNWSKVESQYNNLSKSSEFYQRATFLLRSEFAKDNIPKNLNKILFDINYDQASMRYYTALLDANLNFKNSNFEKAEELYIQALSVNYKNSTKDIVQYNLALTYLKKNELKKASQTFQSIENETFKWKPYHLLYINYLLKKDDAFIMIYDEQEFQTWKVEHYDDALFMFAAIHLSEGKNTLAAIEFLNLWKQTGKVQNLEYAAKAYYRQRDYNKVLELTNDPRLKSSDILFSYRIRSLLGLRKFVLAETEVIDRNISGDQLIQLRMEVWLANKKYRKIIQIIPVLLREALDKEKRIFYYLSMGDAYFNLQQYSKSKNQFYKALAIAGSSEKKSVIYFNIILSTFFSGDKPEFLRELNTTLKKKDLSKNVRYNLTVLQVDYYTDEGNHLLADDLISAYIQEYSHKRNLAFLKRIKLLYDNKELTQCFYLSQTPPGAEEDKFQQRDRLIVGAKCSQNPKEDGYMVRNIVRELSKENNYRRNELDFLLSKAYFNLQNYQNSIDSLENLDLKEAHESIKFQATLLLSKNYLLLKNVKTAQSVLGDVNVFRRSSYYSEALLLSSDIKQAQSNTGAALRSMLRIYYLKNTPEKEKQEILMNMSKLMVKNKNKIKAIKYFKIIQFKKFKQFKDLLKKYQILKINIAQMP